MSDDARQAATELCRRVLLDRIRYESFCRIMGIPIKYHFADGYHA